MYLRVCITDWFIYIIELIKHCYEGRGPSPRDRRQGRAHWGRSTRSQLALYSALSGGSNRQRHLNIDFTRHVPLRLWLLDEVDGKREMDVIVTLVLLEGPSSPKREHSTKPHKVFCFLFADFWSNSITYVLWSMIPWLTWEAMVGHVVRTIR